MSHWRDPLIHPATIAAMAVLGINDHWAKAAHPGLLTGKLSDFAGLVFFPLLLERIPGARAWGPRPARLGAVALTALGFAGVKGLPVVNGAWNDLFTWIYQALGSAAQARVLCDPTDLVALSSLVLPAFYLAAAPDPRPQGAGA